MRALPGLEVVGEMRVYCEAESHEGKRVVVERFHHVRTPDGSTMWLPGGRRGVVWKDRGPGLSSTRRVRYTLKCRSCDVTVPARSDRLAPVFDTLAAHGHGDISLRGLAARLSAAR